MPVIILSEPFIRHHTGTVFKVSDAIGVSGWDDDIRLREKQSCFDQRVYFLPDDGKGTHAELPLPYTFMCPENIFNNVDVKSGPCRITSVSKSLEKAINDPYYASPLPLGKGKITYLDTAKYVKNGLLLDLDYEVFPDKAIIKNRVTGDIMSVNIQSHSKNHLMFDYFEPGFYEIALLKSSQNIHHFTMIKCFPLVVAVTDIRSKYNISPTLW